ncbi:MAG: DoxX family membrane protein [Deltaproteobacteria bacterium]|nr:DoxX family membrane protein [Deltaproteobacteria bacterium]
MSQGSMETGSHKPAGWPNRLLRWLFGLTFIFAAPNHYLQVIQDPPMPPAAAMFHHALTASGYIFQLVVAAEFAGGVLLITGAWMPFALILLAPVIANIFCFHLFLAPGGLPVAAILVIAELILAWQYRNSFRPLFSMGAQG